MTNATLYHKFVKRWEKVTELPPQTVGPLTPYYKAAVRKLKIMPWPALMVAGVLLVLAIYLLIGSTITFVVTNLQKGF